MKLHKCADAFLLLIIARKTSMITVVHPYFQYLRIATDHTYWIHA